MDRDDPRFMRKETGVLSSFLKKIKAEHEIIKAMKGSFQNRFRELGNAKDVLQNDHRVWLRYLDRRREAGEDNFFSDSFFSLADSTDRT